MLLTILHQDSKKHTATSLPPTLVFQSAKGLLFYPPLTSLLCCSTCLWCSSTSIQIV